MQKKHLDLWVLVEYLGATIVLLASATEVPDPVVFQSGLNNGKSIFPGGEDYVFDVWLSREPESNLADQAVHLRNGISAVTIFRLWRIYLGSPIAQNVNGQHVGILGSDVEESSIDCYG